MIIRLYVERPRMKWDVHIWCFGKEKMEYIDLGIIVCRYLLMQRNSMKLGNARRCILGKDNDVHSFIKATKPFNPRTCKEVG